MTVWREHASRGSAGIRAGADALTGMISVSATTSSTGSFGAAANAPNIPTGAHAAIAGAPGRARNAFARCAEAVGDDGDLRNAFNAKVIHRGTNPFGGLGQ